MVEVLASPDLYVHAGGTPPTLAELVARYTRQVRGASPDGGEQWLNWIVLLTVTACIHPANHASAKVAQRLGMSSTSLVIDGEERWTQRLLRQAVQIDSLEAPM